MRFSSLPKLTRMTGSEDPRLARSPTNLPTPSRPRKTWISRGNLRNRTSNLKETPRKPKQQPDQVCYGHYQRGSSRVDLGTEFFLQKYRSHLSRLCRPESGHLPGVHIHIFKFGRSRILWRIRGFVEFGFEAPLALVGACRRRSRWICTSSSPVGFRISSLVRRLLGFLGFLGSGRSTGRRFLALFPFLLFFLAFRIFKKFFQLAPDKCRAQNGQDAGR